ncbi:SprT-like domain-containing protein, partial [Actinomyces oris]
MNLPDVLSLAHSLMEEADVGDWDLAFDRARRRAGQTDHARRRITLSRHLMSLYDETQVRETILHEIAHARVGPSHGHDAVWAAEATRLGATGRRLID